MYLAETDFRVPKGVSTILVGDAKEVYDLSCRKYPTDL